MTINWTEDRCEARGVDHSAVKSAHNRLQSLFRDVLEPAGLVIHCVNGALYIAKPDTVVDRKGVDHKNNSIAEVESSAVEVRG